uniref:Ig-like domain-containing protein n=1 Tax=Oryzias melastigma TaxID=30732 RepID=A0A3B3CHE9_ORYME
QNHYGTIPLLIHTMILHVCLVSGCICEFQTLKVQSGENVTLLCFTTNRAQIDWFRVVNISKVSCISSIFGSDGDPSLCHGFEGGKFVMSSDISSVSLKIIGVNESDSGLYFCGFYANRHTIIGDVTQLIIKGKIMIMCDLLLFMNSRTSFVCVFFTGDDSKDKEKGFSDLNSAALMFPKSRSRRPAESRELETCVIYSVRRQTLF